jgi:hypothetical protein
MATVPARRPAARTAAPPRLALLPLLRDSTLVRLVAADRRWLVPLALTAYVLATTWTWEFPNWQGIPFPPVWLGAVVAALVTWRRLRRAVGPIEVAAIVAAAAMVTTDVTMFWTQPLRDLALYLKAGEAWLEGRAVYATVPLAQQPADLSDYPFLYPPVTLPLFAALSVPPFAMAAAIWLAGSIAAVLGGLRIIGFGWRWSLFLLAWPPIAQGIYVGNVAVPLFVLFAAAVARPALLLVAPVFKLYSGIAALWLLRRPHWPDLARGVVVALGIAAVATALTGVEAWLRWFEGLLVYQESQRLLPQFLYGFGLARWLPLAAVLGLAALVVVLALRASERREQLARLGVATIVGSPSLFTHGWLVALPALARLDTPWLWLSIGLTACAPGLAWFLVVAIVAASWFRPAMRKRPGADAWHPLGAADRAWPAADDTQPRTEEREVEPPRSWPAAA